MIKRLTIFMVLMLSYMSASAQIATPLLDRVMKVQSPAAAGWRDGTTVGIQAVSAESKIKADGDEIGDAEIGAAAKAGLPALLAAYKGEELGVELFYNAGTSKKSKMDYGQSVPTFGVAVGELETEDTLPETRLNLAYVFGELVSVGLGYRSEEKEYETAFSGTVINPTTGAPVAHPVTTAIPWVVTESSSGKETETGLMLSASIQLAEIFYVAAGLENVSYKKSPDVGTEEKNEWSNTIFGLGLLVGEEGESRFRAEYSMITSPEVENSDKTNTHYKTDYNTMSLEALFGSVMLSYINETEKIDNNDEKLVTTQIGVGWMPEEGLAISAYSFALKQTMTQGTSDIEIEPKGWRINIGWNF